MASVQSALAQIERRWDITAYDEQYEGVARASSPADLTAAAIRSCVLVVSVASVASLLNLSQKERAYQSGVLRAMGMGKGWLLVPPVIEGLLTSVVGVLGARLVLERTHSYLGLTRAALVRGFLSDSAWFVGIGFGVVVFTTLTFAFRPVTSLLRDTWGKT
jgi:predicted lysophospholipase L1 biosynthesis ABC-type transport system permease subunit